jgi:hypothetical protein
MTITTGPQQGPPPGGELTFAQRAALADMELAAYGPPDEDEAAAGTTAWPEIEGDAFYGLAGDVVAALNPTTEADPNALLFTFLAWAGCYLGNDAYVLGGNTQHPGRVWPILTGASASGAKGTAVAAVGQFAQVVDSTFYVKNRAGGLSTSEGLIKRVRDQRGDDPEAKDFDEGVADKRLFVNEPEFASVLTRARREGNSLSSTLRDAYDGIPLETITSGSPLFASGHHVTILGAITPGELVERLSSTDITNGFANRFMIVMSKRSKLLPDGGYPDPAVLDQLAQRFRDVATHRPRGRLERTPAASQLWHDEYHARHSRTMPDGPLSALTARWHASSARLSVVYALLDGSPVVDVQHVRASLAAWDYVEASTRHVFGSEDADHDLGRLVEFVDQSDLGVSRKQISIELFQRHKTKKELDALCDKLLGLGRYRLIKGVSETGRGRAPMFYVRVGRGEAAQTEATP